MEMAPSLPGNTGTSVFVQNPRLWDTGSRGKQRADWDTGSHPLQGPLTRPLRLGRPPTEEATELTELMEELLGLWVSAETPMAMRLVFLALAGLVDGKPMRRTLWMGAKRPNLGGHWKYLGSRGDPSCHRGPTAGYHLTSHLF